MPREPVLVILYPLQSIVMFSFDVILSMHVAVLFDMLVFSSRYVLFKSLEEQSAHESHSTAEALKGKKVNAKNNRDKNNKVYLIVYSIV
ncbi:MAG: hypothetical protein DRH04_08645 [Deltaproteobacteria bacterium]|nr:MAG: hypothetical protein DRH04_08645 [Deltaproteobacteria bacterium]